MRTLTLSFLFFCCVSLLSAQAPVSPKPGAALPFTLKPLGHGVYTAIHNAQGDAGANAGFVVRDNGVAVIGTFEDEAARQAITCDLHMVSKLPIPFVHHLLYHL